MPFLPKTVALVASAGLLAAAPVFAATADAHPKAHHHTASAHQHGKPADHLAGPRRGATHAISAQLKAVNALATSAGSLTIPDATGLQSALADDAAAVQADLDAIAQASSVKALHALMNSAITSRQVARVQYQVVVAADAAAATGATLSDTVAAVGTQLTDLAVGGTDVTDGLTALSDATDQLATVAGDVPDVVSQVLAIPSTATRTALHAAMVAAQTMMTAIEDALTQAADDIAAVQAEYSL